VISEMAT